MISIGEFSKLCNVTTKTLRHYAMIELLEPVYINEENGYRFYEVSQLRTMLLIGKLKEYKFSLEEIKTILYQKEADNLKLFLNKLKEVRGIRKNLEVIESDLLKDIQKIKCGGDIMSAEHNIEINLVEMKEVKIFSLREHFAFKDFEKYFIKLYGLAYENNISIAGPCLSIIHNKEYDPENSDIEVGIITSSDGEGVRVLERGAHARATYIGPYESKGFKYAYIKLLEWIDENNYAIIRPAFQECTVGKLDEDDPNKFVTNIYFPVVKKYI